MDHIKEATKKVERSMTTSVKRLRESESDSYSDAMKIVTNINKTSGKICTMILNACSKAEIQVNGKGPVSKMVANHKRTTAMKRDGEYRLDEYQVDEYKLDEYQVDEYKDTNFK